MRMKKTVLLLLRLIIALLTLGIIGAVVLPFVLWQQAPSKSLDIWVVDKTVTDFSYREHKGFMWVLNHMKINNENTSKPFSMSSDYYGFSPIDKENYEIRPIPQDRAVPNLIYITDAYGVYEDDYLNKNIKGTRSDRIYGGLGKEEVALIKNNLLNNTIIAEFNSASSPTDADARKELGDIFGVNFSGWNGRYYSDLTKDVEIPVWVVENYEQQYNEKWNFYGKGFVLVNDNTDQIIVLEKDKDIGKNDMIINFDEKYSKEFEVNQKIPYYYWFECVTASIDNEIIATYSLDVTSEGARKLAKIGITNSFPAIIRNKNSQYQSYYFAGDYADLINDEKGSNYLNYARIKKAITLNAEGKTDYFYWKCYVPLMKKILNDVAEVR